MTSLRELRPEDFLRAGVLFGQVAEQVSDSIGQARSSAEVRWVGPPSMRYQNRLGSLIRDLGSVRRAYDEACDALVAYSRALAAVRDLAIQADLIAAQAEDMRRGRDLDLGMNIFYAPITPAEQALVDRASRLRIEAEDQESVASARLAATLRGLADDAPHLSRWESVHRFVSDAAGSVQQQLDGVAHLVGDVVQAVPFVGDGASRSKARGELWDAWASGMQPWLAVEDLLRSVREDRPGVVAGTLVFAAGTRKAPATVALRVGERASMFGLYKAMNGSVLRAMRRTDGTTELEKWVTLREQKRFHELFQSLQHVQLPPVQVWLDEGIDLMHHEAVGGHSILKHIGRSEEFLRKRQTAEINARGAVPTRSSFLSLDEAQRVGHLILTDRKNAATLCEWASGARRALDLAVKLDASVGRVVDGLGRTVESTHAIMWLARTAEGRPYILSLMLDQEKR